MGPRALALALAWWALAFPAASQPRGSSLVGSPGARSAGPPVLSSLSPAVGVPEGGVLLTLRGANFQRTRGLAVRFAGADVAVVVPATFVDASTVVCYAPPQAVPGVVQVTASNDGAAFSAPPRSSARGVGTFLTYTVVAGRPWGAWALAPAAATFAPPGGARLEVALRGAPSDGRLEGGAFLATGPGLARCVFSTSLRTAFHAFGPVGYAPPDGADGDPAEAALGLPPQAGPAWEQRHQAGDVTYQLRADSNTTFVWRAFPAGFPPSAAEEAADAGWSLTPQSSNATAELEAGLFVAVPTARVGAYWSFDVLTRNPTVVPADMRSATAAACPVPPYAAAAADADPSTPGIQHEVRLSQRGAGLPRAAQSYDAAADSNPPPVAQLPSRDTALLVAGFPGGDTATTYEIRTIAGGTAWEWRRYTGASPAAADVTGWITPFTQAGAPASVADAARDWVLLDNDVSVRFGTPVDKPATMYWVFVAQPAWSTAFSPVAWAPLVPAAVPTTWLQPSGLPRASDPAGAGSYTYQLRITNGGLTFTWLRWPYGGDPSAATSAVTQAVPQTGDPPAALNASGVFVAWTRPDAVADGDVYTWSAFAGHCVTFAATPAVGPVLQTVGAGASPPAVTGPGGEPYGAAYTGVSKVTFVVTVGPGSSQWSWSADGGVTNSSPIDIDDSSSAPLAYGVYLTWPSGAAYTVTDTFSFWAAPVASSVAPPTPTPTPGFTVLGAFAPGGVSPPRDVAVTVEFSSAATFSYRLDLGPWVATNPNPPVALGDTGIALVLDAAGFIAGARYVLWVTSFVPRIDNASTAHAGARAEAATSSPAPARTNRGAGVGLALPDAANLGPPALGLSVVPTPGYAAAGVPAAFGAAGAGGGGLAAPLPAGYAAATAPGAYPVIQLRILGTPSLGAVTGPLPDVLSVTGSYTGTSSMVYTLQAADGNQFKWCYAALGGAQCEPGNATLSSTTATSLGNGLSVSFATATYPVGTAWSFVAAAGHTYAWLRQGAAGWSPETHIAPGPNTLCCGVSVVFDALSGYTTNDTWRLLPYSVSLEGSYGGEGDAGLQLQTLPGTAGALPPSVTQITPLLSSAGSLTGAAAALIVSGVYSGTASMVYQIRVAVLASPEQFAWRRYPAGTGGSLVDWFEAPRNMTLSPDTQILDAEYGLSVSWGATTGRSVNDTWTFVARAGDAFAWRDAAAPGGGVERRWSGPVATGNVGFLAPDSGNVGTAVPNGDVRCGGDYDGSAGDDATLAVEVFVNASAAIPFVRWQLWPQPLPGIASGERPSAAALAASTNWSVAVAATGVPQAVGAGVWVSLANLSAPFAHGDVFYAPLSAPGAWRAYLAHGLAAAWTAPSGFAANDTWSATARAALPARGPLEGGAELRVLGAGFLPGAGALCRLTDAPAGLAPAVFAAEAAADGAALRCRTPPRPPDAVSAPLAAVLGSPTVDVAGMGGADDAPGAASDGHFSLHVEAANALWLYDVSPSAQPLPPLQLAADAAALADGVTWHALADLAQDAVADLGASAAALTSWAPTLASAGLVVRLQPGPYAPGQAWAFRNAALAAAAAGGGDAHPPLDDAPSAVAGFQLKPGRLCTLAVSVDGGVSWAGPPAASPGSSRFLYSAVYVAPDGDDGAAGGDGTRGAPYRTLSRAVAAALAPPRPGPPGAPPGLAGMTDWDTLVLLPGRYTGAGNAGVGPAGRMLVVQASMRGAAVLDCAGAAGGDVQAGDRFAPAGPAGRGSITLQGVATENCGNAYAGGW